MIEVVETFFSSPVSAALAICNLAAWMCIAEERAASAFWWAGGVDGIGDLLEMQGLDFFVAGDSVQLRWQKLARGLYVYIQCDRGASR
jgi:hypothetical protein